MHRPHLSWFVCDANWLVLKPEEDDGECAATQTITINLETDSSVEAGSNPVSVSRTGIPLINLFAPQKVSVDGSSMLHR